MMENRDKQAFAEMMVALAENYGQTVTKAGMALRFEALREFAVADVQRAAMSLIRSRKYTSMPTVADFLEHLGGGSVEDKAEAAAAKALRAVSEVGRYASVAFDDPVLMAVIEGSWGSWPEFCAACSGSEVKFVRRESAGRQAVRASVRHHGKQQRERGLSGAYPTTGFGRQAGRCGAGSGGGRRARGVGIRRNGGVTGGHRPWIALWFRFYAMTAPTRPWPGPWPADYATGCAGGLI